jgi:uncharacterized RDD family membrane protein YckC
MSNSQALDTSTLDPFAVNPYQPPSARLDYRPGSVALAALATPGSRFAAKFVDTVALLSVLFLGIVLMAIEGDEFGPLSMLGIVVMLGGLVAICVLDVVLLQRNGQTLGKKLCNIKIVNNDGSDVELSRVILVRFCAARLLANFVPFFGLVDALFVFREDRRCIHDMMAGTAVVDA